MENPKQTVSVLLCIFSLISVLCFLNNFDLSTIIFLLSDVYQLINKRNMILLCHFILIFIVKDSGLLSRQKNEVGVRTIGTENRVQPVENYHGYDLKEVPLEGKEEISRSNIQKPLDIVVMEKADGVVQTNGEGELNKEILMEIMASTGVEKWEDLSEEEVERNETEVWDLVAMERSVEEEEMENECAEIMVQMREEEPEKESVDELHRKIEEFIRQMKMQMRQPVLV